MNDVPHCLRKLGTVSVMDGDDPSGWTQFQLAGPQKLIKVLVQRSGCFNLVDRGSGLSAAQRERDIGGGMGMQRGSNVGQGQIKAADYVLVAEVQAADSNSGGGARGAGRRVRRPSWASARRSAASARARWRPTPVLSLTNVRTTETLAVQDGYAAKNSISWGGGGGGFFGAGLGLVGGGYDSTDIGRIVTLAFIQAYSKMVYDLGLVTPGSVGTAEAAPDQDLHRAGLGRDARQRRRRRQGRPHPPARSDRLSDRRQGRPVVASRRRERQCRLGHEHEAGAFAVGWGFATRRSVRCGELDLVRRVA